MDDHLLDAMCEHFRTCLYIEDAYTVREGEPVGEMLFIIRGHVESREKWKEAIDTLKQMQ